jgi:formate dehydrogenase (coenzyme F420) beta subunit
MGTTTILKVESQGPTVAVRQFLGRLLELKLVEAIVVPLESDGGVAPAMITATEAAGKAAPFAPLMSLNSARLVSSITRAGPSPRRLGVVMRPCELRALIELVKLKQAYLENLVLIGIDCPGTCSLSDYRQLNRSGDLLPRLLRSASGEAEIPLRAACRSCTHPVPLGTDLTIGLFGLDVTAEIAIIAESEKGDDIVRAVGLDPGAAPGRDTAVSSLLSQRARLSAEALSGVSKTIEGIANLRTALSNCVGCHNCRRACPVCYCRECFFDSSVMDFEASKYLEWASRRTAVRMPTDILLFHLTRLNHMATSCVGCGMCTEACPNGIQVSDVFRMVAASVQKSMEYEPGRSLDDALPLSTFKEDELGEVGI